MKLKKLVAGILAAITVFCMAAFAVGCTNNGNGGNSEPKPEDPTVTSISIAPETAVLNLGETLDYSKYTITVKYTGEKEDETISLRETMISEDDKAKLSVAGDYDIIITAYGKTTTLKVTVKKLAMEGITAESVTETYSGKPVYPVVKGAPQGADITYTVYEGKVKGDKTVDAAVDAGEYFVEATVSARNYESVTVSANVTINKKAIKGADLSWKNVNAIYTGEDVELAATVDGLPEGITLKGFSGTTKAKEKGVYSATAEFEGENKNYTISDYTFTWSILDSNDVRMEKWYAAKGGELYVAEFTSDSVVINGTSYPCTVTYDEAGKPAFAMGGGIAITSIALNGSVLVVTEGEDTLNFIVKTNLDNYYAGEFSTYYEDFTVSFDETNDTATLIRQVRGQDAVSYGISLDFGTNASDASKARITVEDSEIYLEYNSSYKTLNLYNYANPVNFNKVDSYGLTLARKVDVDALAEKIFEGDFVSNGGEKLEIVLTKHVILNGEEITDGEFVDNNQKKYIIKDKKVTCDGVEIFNGTFTKGKGDETETLVVKDVKFNLNERPVVLYAFNYYGTTKFRFSKNSNNIDIDFTINTGYYVIGSAYSGSAFYNVDYKDFVGVYYLKNSDGVSNSETVSFNEDSGYVRVKAKIDGATSSTDFDFGKDSASSNTVTLDVKDGKLIAILYKKGETEAFATVTFDKNGNATCGDNSYCKVENLVPKVDYSGDGKYHSVDGRVFSYNGKGTFTLDGVEYTEYKISYDNNRNLTLTLTRTENNTAVSHTVVYYNDERYVTVDSAIYLSDDAATKTNGFLWNGTYINGDKSFTIEDGTFVYGDANLTDVKYSFVDDGHKNGRTVLQIVGNAGSEKITVLYYSLAAVKITTGSGDSAVTTAYVFNAFENLFGSEFKPSADSKDSVEITTAGEVKFQGIEVFPSRTKGGNSAYLSYYITLDGQEYFHQMYIYAMSLNFSDNVNYNYDVNYYTSAYFVFNGLYMDEAKEHVFYFDASKIFYNNTDTTSYTVGKLENNSASITISGKEGLFTKDENGNVTLVFDGVDYSKVENFNVNNYFGTYNVYDGSSYNMNVVFNNIKGDKVYLYSLVMLNGELTPVIYLNDAYSKVYLLKNSDPSTSAATPYLAVKDTVVKILGNAKVNDKDFVVKVVAGRIKDSTGIGAVLNAVYGNETATMEYKNNRWYVTLNGVEYLVEENRDEETKKISGILVYESWYYNYTSDDYVLNDKTLRMDPAVSATGNTVIKVAFDGETVNASFLKVGDYNVVMTFTTVGGVNYKVNMSTEYDNPRVRPVTEKEYEFFFGDSDEQGLYTVKMDGKDFKFDYSLNTEFKSKVSYIFVLDLAKTTYNGKPVTFAQYVYESNVLVFVTEEGSFAYNVNDGTFYKDVLPENFSVVGNRFKGAKSTEIKDLSVFVKIVNFEEGKAVLGFVYDFDYSSDGAANVAFSVTELENSEGYKLMGYIKDKVVVSYLLSEGETYALYSADQYTIAGTYDTHDGKYLVINGTHANGSYTYTAKYGNGAETEVTIDFNGRSFTMGEGVDTKIVTWVINNGIKVFSVQGIPKSAFDFETKYSADAYNAYFTSNTCYFNKITISKIENGTVYYEIYGKVGYSSVDGVEGVLSSDGTHIVAKLGYSNYYIFLNGCYDDFYKYTLLYEGGSADSCAKYAGKFTVDGKELEIKHCAESLVEEDEYEEEYLAGCKDNYFTVTYLGKTVRADTAYDDTLSSGLEFTIDGTTYVAKLNNGEMTVTAK